MINYETGSRLDTLHRAAVATREAYEPVRDAHLAKALELKAMKLAAGDIKIDDLWGKHREAAGLPQVEPWPEDDFEAQEEYRKSIRRAEFDLEKLRCERDELNEKAQAAGRELTQAGYRVQGLTVELRRKEEARYRWFQRACQLANVTYSPPERYQEQAKAELNAAVEQARAALDEWVKAPAEAVIIS